MPTNTTLAETLYRAIRSVKVGQLERFHVHFTPEQSLTPPPSLWLRVRNTELIALRAAFLAGPFTLYVDVRSDEYDPNQTTFITADQPQFEPELTAGRSFVVELPMHTLRPTYRWTVDVMSQVLFNPATCVNFEVQLGWSKDAKGTGVGLFDPRLTVTVQDTLDLWNLPQPAPGKPIHLVVLTHGLHSNIGTDMLYVKEAIEAANLEGNVMVRGYHGNACRTERGVKYLGSRVAEWVMEVYAEYPAITSVSFVGHSLGGLVQTFALAYLESNHPSFFKAVTPRNFITLASPMLGIASENPAFITMALTAGVVGKTGHDLGLKHVDGHKPLLTMLPTGPTHRILQRFQCRTVYANASNDGIVPIRTSALLYLDYKGLKGVEKAKTGAQEETHSRTQKDTPTEAPHETHGESLREETQPTSLSIPAPAYFSYPASSTPEIGEIPVSKKNSAQPAKGFFAGSALETAVSFFLPYAQKKPERNVYERFQTVARSDDALDCAESSAASLHPTSMIGSAAAFILPSVPPTRFINDPHHREPVVFHDRLYEAADLPPPLARETSFIQSIDPFHSIARMEESIARAYHHNMAWRKVLVNLKPDAHNNIIVRRRFANAYGWPVIDHLVQNHFGPEPVIEPRRSSSPDSLYKPAEFSFQDLSVFNTILAQDQRAEEDQGADGDGLANLAEVAAPVQLRTIGEVEEDERWINRQGNAESIFAVGPTGMISNVGEFVENFRSNLCDLAKKNGFGEEPKGEDGLSIDTEARVMEGFY